MSNENKEDNANQMDHAIRSIQKKRTANFREDETRLLIQLWGSPSVQNKLLLTHRKAPVMRLLAANMQQRGFYRTPDEIKTRIRNLKCLYHRIKRSTSSGIGIGTVDPDWPHYKAMDEILTKVYPRKLTDRLLDEPDQPKFDDILVKTEIDDVDMDDDDSWVTNESLASENDDDAAQAPSTSSDMINSKQSSSSKQERIPLKKTTALQVQHLQQIVEQPNAVVKAPIQLQSVLKSNVVPQLPTLPEGKMPVQNGTLPFPLLILNNVDHSNECTTVCTNLLKEIIDLQTQSIDLGKQQIEMQKERLEFDRSISQEIVSMLGNVLQGLAHPITPDHTELKCIDDKNEDSPASDDKEKAD